MDTFLYIKPHSGKIFDITHLITKISFAESLNDGCSKLEFSYINQDLIIENGCEVAFAYNGMGIFGGRVFKVSRNDKKEISVTAYDQLRYAKAEGYLSTEGYTVSGLVNKMCTYFKFTKDQIDDTRYMLKTKVYDGHTWLDVIYESIDKTLINTGRWYVLRDEFSHITLRNVADLTINLILGDKASCYGYSYEKSIDDNFYNQVLILAKNKTQGKLYCAKNDKSIERYGLLQFYKSEDNTNAGQAQALANMILKDYNSEKTIFSLECLGDVRIRAGVSFYGMIGDIMGDNVRKKLIVKSVTHNFIPVHTMKIEVEAYDK